MLRFSPIYSFSFCFSCTSALQFKTRSYLYSKFPDVFFLPFRSGPILWKPRGGNTIRLVDAVLSLIFQQKIFFELGLKFTPHHILRKNGRDHIR